MIPIYSEFCASFPINLPSLSPIDFDTLQVPGQESSLLIGWQGDELIKNLANDFHRFRHYLIRLVVWSDLHKKYSAIDRDLGREIWLEFIESELLNAVSFPIIIRDRVLFTLAYLLSSIDPEKWSKKKTLTFSNDLLASGRYTANLRNDQIAEVLAGYSQAQDFLLEVDGVQQLNAFSTLTELRNMHHHRLGLVPPGFQAPRIWPSISEIGQGPAVPVGQAYTLGVQKGIELNEIRRLLFEIYEPLKRLVVSSHDMFARVISEKITVGH